MAFDATTGNALSNSVAAHLKNVNDQVNNAKKGVGQAYELAGIKQDLEANKDALIQSVGQDKYAQIQNNITLLNADTRDGLSEEGGAAASYSQDINDFVSLLNQSGLQVSASEGKGHYDAGTVLANATGYNVDANTADSAIQSANADLSDALSTMNGSAPGSPEYLEANQNAKTAMGVISLAASNWSAGQNLSPAGKEAMDASLKATADSAGQFSENPALGNAYRDSLGGLLRTMSGLGYTGSTTL